MRSKLISKFGIAAAMLAIVSMPSFAASTKAHAKNASTSRGSHFRHLRKVATWKRHGQQQISSDRTREIQEALIREHYLDGQPNGVWDDRTATAMRKFQADQGWQSKVVPDSRAIIKLGLGPSHENDLNPDLMGKSAFTPGSPAELPQR
jgi:peptidoglycan hydrolase-like protein with peptidoglycan-binding domain